MKRVEYLEKTELAKKFTFSPAVITQGGRPVFRWPWTRTYGCYRCYWMTVNKVHMPAA